jgi:DNA-directed RNA polymerase subunit beta'
VVAEDIIPPRARKPLIAKGTLLTDAEILKLKSMEKPIEEIRVRSVMTCKNRRGLCQQCYGFDLAYNQAVHLGAAIGVVAAQSVGEPGTQLTMRTFHTGGVASGQDITQGLPRVEELFEARNPKHAAIMAPVAGKASIVTPEIKEIRTATGQQLVDTARSGKIIRIMSDQLSEDVFVVTSKDTVKIKEGDTVSEGEVIIVRNDGTEIVSAHDGTVKLTKNRLTVIWQGLAATDLPSPVGFKILIKDGDEVQAGDQLTEGHLDLQMLFRTKGHKAVMQYLLREVLSIYATQGQKINSKHIELLIRQMFSRSYVKDAGDTDLLPGEIVERCRAQDEIDRVVAKGGRTAVLEDLFLGITKVALTTESFLSSASFQETARVLIHAAITGKVDRLEGLKENVIIGRLIPAGTGFGYHHPELNLEPVIATEPEMPELVEEIVEETQNV